jgi:glycosyltransferase involved in cell wall biosynthesis
MDKIDNQLISNQKNKSLISIVIPVFNEEGNVERAYHAVKEVFEQQLNNKYDFEIIFTDNHSIDNSYQELQVLAMQDPRVRVARFTRNFGFNKSLLTGYRLAQGDAAIQLDCDLQDSPTLFVTLLSYWEMGHDVVVGKRKSQRAENFLMQNARKTFYRLLKRISEDNVTLDGGDFRLIDRSILDKLQSIHDATPYVRGLVTILASKQKDFSYERQERVHGKSKFPLFRLFGLAIDGIVSHSIVPLRLASLFGLFIATTTFLLAIGYFFARLFFIGSWPSGFATQVVLLLFSIALNAIFLGIIGEYLGRIYKQLRYHPLTIIESSINLTKLI